MSAIFSAKHFRHFEIFGVSAWTRGGQASADNFLVILCGRLLWTAPYEHFNHSKVNFTNFHVWQRCYQAFGYPKT